MALSLLEVKRSTSFNSKTNTDYVYEVSVFWDEEAQKKIYKRKVIGKIDPVTKQEIPTSPKGRPRHVDPVNAIPGTAAPYSVPEETSGSRNDPGIAGKTADMPYAGTQAGIHDEKDLQEKIALVCSELRSLSQRMTELQGIVESILS